MTVPTEAEKFKDAMRKIVVVPKSEIIRREKEYQRSRKEKRNKLK